MHHSEKKLKRHLLKLLAAWPFVQAFGAGSSGDTDQRRRFRDIGIVLVTDAVAGAEMKGVMMYDDQGAELYGKSLLSRRNRDIASYSSIRVPRSVRVLWRINPKPIWGKNGGIDYQGEIAGDYTLPVASRIPDDILADIRAHGGSLRLKFRLKPDGVMLGWDIERKAPLGNVSIFERPGGDFLETRY